MSKQPKTKKFEEFEEIFDKGYHSLLRNNLWIKEMQDKELIASNYGIDFSKKEDLLLAKIVFDSPNPEKIFSDFKDFTNILNIFKTNENPNIMMLSVFKNIKNADNFIEKYISNYPDISDFRIEFITDYSNPFSKKNDEEKTN